MKKLVVLSIAVLFVVVGIAGMAQAAATASASLTGDASIGNFTTYKCVNAKVKTNSAKFPGTKSTNANGKYAWTNQSIPAGNDTTGVVNAKFDLAMFGATLRFVGNAPFAFIDPVQFGTPTETVDVIMSLDSVIF